MGNLILLMALVVVLTGTHLVAYRAGLSRGSSTAQARVQVTQRQLHEVVRAARRAVAADPSMPADTSLRRQELALALDEYDAARAELP